MKEATQGKSSIAGNPHIAPAGALGDFTTTWRVLPITGLALVIGVVSAYVAVVLLKLINFFTNLFFFHRLSFRARELSVATEHHRERVLRLRVPPSLRWRTPWALRGKNGTSTKET